MLAIYLLKFTIELMIERLDNQRLLIIILGSLFSVLMHWPILLFMKWLNKNLKKVEDKKLSRKEKNLNELDYFPVTIGIIERIAYVAALGLNLPGFIAVWLGIKAAGGLTPSWHLKWTHIGHARLIKFQIGTLLSLLSAVISYYLAVSIVT